MRVKTNHTFRLSKRNKTILALSPHTDAEQRHAFKNAMIDAQVAASVVVKSVKDKDRNSTKGE
jgi:hypothetical protein